MLPPGPRAVSSGEQSLDGSIDEERGALSDSDVNHVARTHVCFSLLLCLVINTAVFQNGWDKHSQTFPKSSTYCDASSVPRVEKCR